MDKLISALDAQFAGLHTRSIALIEAVPEGKLYWQPRQSSGAFPVYSCGEHVLRSAAAVEQTSGGISVNLWDDPFEWTLPEALPTPEDVARYLEEAEATRRRAFEFLRSDEDIGKEIAVPSGEMRTLFSLAVE